MTKLLLDSNVVSFVVKGDSRAEVFRPLLHGNDLYIAFVSLGEILRWPLVRDWSAERTERLKSRLEHYKVLETDGELCQVWAEVASIKGRPVSFHDAWIAATAIRHNLPLVTHNRRNFEGIPRLKLLPDE